jgi:hypothetical protein
MDGRTLTKVKTLATASANSPVRGPRQWNRSRFYRAPQHGAILDRNRAQREGLALRFTAVPFSVEPEQESR